jgi:hypothetical protein
MTEDLTYLSGLSQAHIDASAAALKEVARRASTTHQGPHGAPLKLRLGHVDHGGFLSLQLQLFSVYEVRDNHLIDIGEKGGEVVVAITVNQPVEVQIRAVLGFLQSLVGRQTLIARKKEGEGEGIGGINAEVQAVDAAAAREIADVLRFSDWRVAADQLANRAEAEGFSLEVRFAAPLLGRQELETRTPLVRCIYNTESTVRDAVDKAVGLMSLSMKVSGPGLPQEVLDRAREVMEHGQVRQYLAHLLRDAFVCGNGYLQLSGGPTPSFRLLRPERVERTGESNFENRDDNGVLVPVSGTVLHLQGGHQVSSAYGISLLEPFMAILGQREIFSDSATIASNTLESTTDMSLRSKIESWTKEIEVAAEEFEADSRQRIADLLGRATEDIARPDASELYFPGMELMSDAADSIRFENTRSTRFPN